MLDNHSAKESIFHKTRTPQRFIPADVLDQFDMLLGQATQRMARGEHPGILKPIYWEALLILRRTGILIQELIHLKELDGQGRDCCLDQDSDGSWWLHIHRKTNKVVKERRIPIRGSSEVVEALHRQRDRARGIPSDEKYLFRNQKGVLIASALRTALAKDLAPYLMHDGRPYVISPSQFRFTIAIEMIQQGLDVE